MLLLYISPHFEWSYTKSRKAALFSREPFHPATNTRGVSLSAVESHSASGKTIRLYAP
jgi:hypothetical protein